MMLLEKIIQEKMEYWTIAKMKKDYYQEIWRIRSNKDRYIRNIKELLEKK